MKMQSLIVSGLVFASAQVASAVTIGYWQLNDGLAGNAATTIASQVNAPDANGVASGNAGGPVPVFSSDTPGPVIRDGLAGSFITNGNNTSLSFDNTGGVNSTGGGVVTIQDPAGNNSLLEPSGNFTVEGFVKINSHVNFASLVGKARTPGNNASWEIDTNSNGTLRLRVDSNTTIGTDVAGGGDGQFNQALGTGFNLEDSQWHHFAMTYDAAQRRVTLFGDYLQQNTTILGDSGIIQFDDFPLHFGNLAGGRALDGLLDEIRYSTGILTTAQFLRASPLPEPASASLLILGAAALMRRRRLA